MPVLSGYAVGMENSVADIGVGYRYQTSNVLTQKARGLDSHKEIESIVTDPLVLPTLSI
ncbi:MAG: hypothetical protein KTR18_06995 [Acidiferrobacterales bacterium]|nr:hypothetical protein [Acidiferrobacterales bacterium]